MKKICYVVSIPLTIESFFIPQLQYLAENDFDVTVICSPSDTLQAQLGEKVRFIPVSIPRGISLGGSVRAITLLTEVFKKEQFDLIQYSTPNAAFYSSIAACIAGCKIRNYHLMGLRYLGALGTGRLVLKILERITCWNSTHIECVSQSNLELGIKEGLFSPNKATVVWHGSSGGIDLCRFDFSKRGTYRREIRNQYGINDDEFVYGFVGRITKDKGINELLEAFSGIDEAKLMLVGPKEDNDSLNEIRYEASLNDSRIIYTGLVTDVEKYYSAIDVLVLPSYREGFGNVVIEAAAMGTPAIVSDIPGPIDAIVDQKTGYRVLPGDADALLALMEKCRAEDIEQKGKDAASYVANFFDSKQLNCEILKRKVRLMYNE